MQSETRTYTEVDYDPVDAIQVIKNLQSFYQQQYVRDPSDLNYAIQACTLGLTAAYVSAEARRLGNTRVPEPEDPIQLLDSLVSLLDDEVSKDIGPGYADRTFYLRQAATWFRALVELLEAMPEGARYKAADFTCYSMQIGRDIERAIPWPKDKHENDGSDERGSALAALQTFRDAQSRRHAGRLKARDEQLQRDMAAVRAIWDATRLKSRNDSEACDEVSKIIKTKHRDLPSSTRTIERYRAAGWSPEEYLRREARRRNKSHANRSVSDTAESRRDAI